MQKKADETRTAQKIEMLANVSCVRTLCHQITE